ncbi:MAG: peptide chain release factor N(5)-glutamine methyltransferase [Flavihumibacter sp.]
MAINELGTALDQLTSRLAPLYGEREAFLMAGMCLEKLTGIRQHAQKRAADTLLDAAQITTLAGYEKQLLLHRPIQYVLEEAWFRHLPFWVKEGVLIPRPETEELVEWVTATGRHWPAGTRVLDVGTGSGCIAIALAKKLPTTTVMGIDSSGEALQIARTNQQRLGGTVSFRQADFLSADDRKLLPPAHCIVSNPPYIPLGEKNSMQTQVTAYEPGSALFVPDEDPLVFYEALAGFTLQQEPGALLFVEIHEKAGAAVCELFRKAGLQQVTLKQDMQGKDRMVCAVHQ